MEYKIITLEIISELLQLPKDIFYFLYSYSLMYTLINSNDLLI